MCGISLSNTLVCLGGGFLLIFIDSLPLSTDSLFEICVCGISLSNTRVCLRGGFLLIYIDSLRLSTDSLFETCVAGITLSNTRVCLFEGRVFSRNSVCLPFSTNGCF